MCYLIAIKKDINRNYRLSALILVKNECWVINVKHLISADKNMPNRESAGRQATLKTDIPRLEAFRLFAVKWNALCFMSKNQAENKL